MDHEDSNYKLCEDHLFCKLPIPREKIHTIDEAYLDDVQELSDQYEQELVKCFANKSSVKTPAFDLLLLGMGPDGHTCSLFPGHALLNETDGWVAPITDSPKPPPKRITLLLHVVTHAHRIAYVVAGAEKKGGWLPQGLARREKTTRSLFRAEEFFNFFGEGGR